MPSPKPHALITGITGQDGSYLAEFLLSKGYEVFGLIRRSSIGPNMRNIAHIQDRLTLIAGDMTDSDSLKRAIEQSDPKEVYNLAAQSFVPMSWASPTYTMNVNSGGFIYLLEAVRAISRPSSKPIRIYQASTSEMYGDRSVTETVGGNPRTKEFATSAGLGEHSPMIPRSPYGVSKLAAHRLAAVYRESFGMSVYSGICFNHESPRRGEMFVTRKITKLIAQMFAGEWVSIQLGNIEARRDWGYAGDYVEAMWRILNQSKPDDYVIGTGIAHSVEDFLIEAFRQAKELTDSPAPMEEDQFLAKIGHDPALYRPAEISTLVADASKIERAIGWKPTVDFQSLVRMMVQSDMKQLGLQTI
jgi:GDPmannose 4,6-dehydratase